MSIEMSRLIIWMNNPYSSLQLTNFNLIMLSILAGVGMGCITLWLMGLLKMEAK